MCEQYHYKITETYGCGHSYDIKTRCKDQYQACHANSNHSQFSAKNPAREGILSKLFRLSSTPKKDLSTRYKQIDDICQKCKNREAEKRARAGTPYQAPYDLAQLRAQQVLKATKTIRAGKYQFHCWKCKTEGRLLVHQAQRTANSGLCCENGRLEWARAEKLASSRPSRNDLLPSNGHSNLARANNHLELRSPSPTTAAARQAANQASQGYGWSRDQPLRSQSKTTREERHVTAVGYDPWRVFMVSDRDSAHLEPGLAQDLISLSSHVPGSMHPTQRTDQGTYYIEPGIDFDRWDSHPRTYHGRIPIPPPQCSLPQPPPGNSPQGRQDLLKRQPAPQTSQNQSWPGQSAGSSSSCSSLQRTPPQQHARRVPQTPQRQLPPYSNIFLPTPATTSSSSSQLHYSSHTSSSRHQLPTSKSVLGGCTLRSTRGIGWYDASYARSPPVTPSTKSRPESSQSRLSDQDLTSVSRLTEPFSAPLNWDEDEEQLSVKPPIYGSNSRSYPPQNSQASSSREQERVMRDQSNVDNLIDETMKAAEYWGSGLRSTRSRRRR